MNSSLEACLMFDLCFCFINFTHAKCFVSVSWKQYQHTTGPAGVRIDKDKRPELSLGSYETSQSEKVRFFFFLKSLYFVNFGPVLVLHLVPLLCVQVKWDYFSCVLSAQCLNYCDAF